MTPATRPAEPHTITRSVPLCRKFAASVSGASSDIVTSSSRAAGSNLSTYIALSPSSFIIRMDSQSSRFDPSPPHSLRQPRCGVFRIRASFLSTTESDTQSGHDTRGRERTAAKTHRDHRRELGPRMYVVLDNDLQAKRGVIKERDQKQDHQNGSERL